MDQHCQSNSNKQSNKDIFNNDRTSCPPLQNTNNNACNPEFRNVQPQICPIDYQQCPPRNLSIGVQHPSMCEQPCYTGYGSQISYTAPVYGSNVVPQYYNPNNCVTGIPSTDYYSSRMVSPYPYANQCYVPENSNFYNYRPVTTPVKNYKNVDSSASEFFKSLLIIFIIIILIVYLTS